MDRWDQLDREKEMGFENCNCLVDRWTAGTSWTKEKKKDLKIVSAWLPDGPLGPVGPA